ncbi:MAG: hypothetical protein U0169_23755 [Polyangiaceae bacterium]
MNSDVATFLVVLAAPALLAYVQWTIAELRGRDAWRRVALPPVEAESSAYRSAPVVPGHLERSPLMLRVVAYTAIVFGQAFLPGIALVCIGVVSVVGAPVALLQGIPGIVLAYRLWASGYAILGGGLYAYRDAMKAATNVASWNFVLVILSLGAAIASAAGGSVEWLTAYAILTGPYAVISASQALVTMFVVRRYRRYFQDDGLPTREFTPGWAVRLFETVGVKHRAVAREGAILA